MCVANACMSGPCSVRQNVLWSECGCGFPQLEQTDHHVGNLMPASFRRMPPLMFLPGLGRVVALHDGDMLSTTSYFSGVDAEHAACSCRNTRPAITRTWSAALRNADGAALRAFVCECHCLPNLGSQGNNLANFFSRQFSLEPPGAKTRVRHRFRAASVLIKDRGRCRRTGCKCRSDDADLCAIAQSPAFTYGGLFYLAFRRGLRFTDAVMMSPRPFQATSAPTGKLPHSFRAPELSRHRQTRSASESLFSSRSPLDFRFESLPMRCAATLPSAATLQLEDRTRCHDAGLCIPASLAAFSFMCVKLFL